ncbi:hypothetical protein [Calothrix sp. 336/3]|uniref:hypothetical protein n=1 Tax=Calothrix sp. 336/3 TaxID=1337936 RepID=UPI000AC2E8CC|nr:hypothetical protein [Calothrix sp. 336/3]
MTASLHHLNYLFPQELMLSGQRYSFSGKVQQMGEHHTRLNLNAWLSTQSQKSSLLQEAKWGKSRFSTPLDIVSGCVFVCFPGSAPMA